MTIHELAKIFMHMNPKKSNLVGNHRSPFITCNDRSMGTMICFYLRFRCSMKRFEVDILDLLDSSPPIHLEACLGHAPDRQLFGPSPSPLASCELLRELISRGLDDVALILRINLIV
jgi:hypothetical protein